MSVRNRTYRKLPCYTGDVSGVCSALYELGGMVVIHDPSGCNSTYNTHDEIRWYTQDSLIFISGFSESDALMGRDDKLVDEVIQAAYYLQPRFIALVNSPIPYINGTDFPALARIIERKTGIPAFYVPTNGMHDYIRGAGAAFAEIARRFVSKTDVRQPHTVNLLGVTPLDFAANGSAAAMRELLREDGWHVLSCWAMGDDLDALTAAGQATVNLVVSAAGLPAAQVLQERFGTPVVCGTPLGGAPGFWAQLVYDLQTAADTGQNRSPCLRRFPKTDLSESGSTHDGFGHNHPQPSGKDPDTDSPAITLIGEPVTMGSVAASAADISRCPAKLLCPLEVPRALLAPGDVHTGSEEELARLVRSSRAVIADPLYRRICPPEIPFYPLPHLAYSGRSYLRNMKNLPHLSLTSFLEKEVL